MTPAASDPVSINEHVVNQERQIRSDGNRTYYRCQACGERAERPHQFRRFKCGEHQ